MRGLLVTVIQMDGKDCFREDLVTGADDGFQHPLVRVRARSLGNLDDERGLGIDAALEQAHGLLRIVDVVRADGVLAVGMLKQRFGRHDHGRGCSSSVFDWGVLSKCRRDYTRQARKIARSAWNETREDFVLVSMERTKTLLVILFVVGAFALVFISVRPPSLADQSSPGLLTDSQIKPAPDFTLQGFHLQTETKKQPIVLDFWATWCGPCRDELPHLEALSKRYAGRVGFYGVNSSDTPLNIATFSRQEGMTFPMLSDAQHKVAAQYGVEAIPLLIVIDTRGKVRSVTEGYDEQIDSNLPKVLDSLLSEK